MRCEAIQYLQCSLVETGRFVGREGADRIIVEKSDPDERLIWRESD